MIFKSISSKLPITLPQQMTYADAKLACEAFAKRELTALHRSQQNISKAKAVS